MKRILVGLCLCLVSGCQDVQLKLNKDIQTLTEPDLQQAHAIATNPAHPDPNPAHDMCWSGLLTVVQALPTTSTTTAPAQTPNGIASLVEYDLAASPIAPLTLPSVPKDVQQACNEVIGELTVKATTDSLKLQAAIVATLAKFHIKP